MLYNYLVSWETRKPHRKKQIHGLTDQVEIPIELTDDNWREIHELIKDEVRQKHPGTYLSGWCPTEEVQK